MKLPVFHSSIDSGPCRVDSPSDRRSPDYRTADDLNRELSIGSQPAEFLRAEMPRWKRLLDLAFTIVTLPCWLTLFVAIALWIKCVSPGPLFFRQERVGYRGRRFLILKFRTMKVNVETLSHQRHFEQLIQTNTPMTKLDACGDPRIIPSGRIIRAIGLDELPQLFNVLRGEMSLVGPRPCTVQEFENYLPWHCERTNALPGLTGYWQVNGKNKTTFTEMIKMDVYYARNASLRLDLGILLKTPLVMIGQALQMRVFGSPIATPDVISSNIVEQPQGSALL